MRCGFRAWGLWFHGALRCVRLLVVRVLSAMRARLIWLHGSEHIAHWRLLSGSRHHALAVLRQFTGTDRNHDPPQLVRLVEEQL
ncbi:hypothetical protein ANI01nite_26440 [Glutamicibacter nicotianae]|uniref:Secreted protein n=1 Tax=Glutamicibacter nicotianae TaxID=37929 RepID=A0ABQ0RNQ7_GLUNI|nr:hypothetical protein ANI01nite_26440 [Glutamicibacter nicotianae]